MLKKLVSNCFLKSSTDTSSVHPNCPYPALFTRTSNLPPSAITFLIAETIDSSLSTSKFYYIYWKIFFFSRMFFNLSCLSKYLSYLQKCGNHLLQVLSDVSNPIPDELPVTRATFSISCAIFLLYLSHFDLSY